MMTTSIPIARHFEEQAALKPDAIALVSQDGQLSYAGLNEKANRLAHLLISLGVGPETPVGVCLQRSADMVAALLAILKAGGAYVPLDAAFPTPRLAEMIRQTGTGLLLTQASLGGRLAALDVRLHCLEPLRSQLARQSCTNPALDLSPQSLAYVIFTSGSTGRPKGVAATHQGVVRLVKGTDYADIEGGEIMLQFAPLSFDASTFEIWGTLLNGGCLVQMPEGEASLESLGQAVQRHGVTTLWLTTGLFHLMVDERLDDLRRLRQLMTGGEVLSIPHAGRALDGLSCRIFNAYGPTENTTFTTFHRLEKLEEGSSVPIGRPISETQVYVLDSDGRPTQPGQPGELCTGGLGLARGYFGRPALTARLFVPDAVSGRPGQRLYRSGDLVGQRPDGEFEFLGRIDQQVKIRGFRIEPAEVEAVLRKHPAMRSAAVVVRERQPGDKRLVAYFVAHDPALSSRKELRSYMQSQLPEFMIPSAWMALDLLPLTPNGKVDQRALPPPDWSSGKQGFVQPGTAVEMQLAALWREVLGVERVGLNDNFFELGGNSLQAFRLLSRLRRRFAGQWPLSKLMESPRLSEQARWIEESRLHPPCQEPAETKEEAASKPWALSFAQQRLWFLEQLTPGSPVYCIPIAYQIEGDLNLPALRASLNEVVRRHEPLRCRFSAVQGQPFQIVEEGIEVPLPRLDLQALSPAESEKAAARLAVEHGRRPFDLQRAPLLRASLLRLAPNRHLLLLNVHHIVADGWSMQIIVRELETLCDTLARGLASPLAPLPLRYRDYAERQIGQLQGERMKRDLAYWKSQIGQQPPRLDLPSDRPRPSLQSYRGAALEVELPAGLTEALRELALRQDATLFMALLAAFQILLQRHCSQDSFLVGAPNAGREDEDVEGLVGFFVNTLALRADLSGDPSFLQLLGRVRTTVVGALEHSGLPFEKLVDELSPQRDLSHNPLVQTMFALQNIPLGSGEGQGLRLIPRQVQNGTSRFDLSLLLTDTPQGLRGTLEYSSDLFDATTVRRLLGHFRTLLRALADDPQRRISRLPLMEAAEQRQLQTEWNNTSSLAPQQLCLHQLFEAQAQRTPRAVAVLFGTGAWNYRRLDRLSNRIARRLRRAGAGPETLVGVCLQRSPQMLAALLGVLKSGAAYLPLDPAYPASRLAFMLQDSSAVALITQKSLLPLLPPFEAPLLCIDEEDWQRESPKPLGLAAEQARLAYLIYTSGSTGRPKGVAIEHRSACILVQWARLRFNPGELSGVLASTSICFDLSVFEIFAPLAWGGTLLLAANALALAGHPQADRVRLINTVPSAITELLRLGAVPEAATTVCLAGEALPAELAQRLYGLGHIRRVFNLYGPSEDTTYSTEALLLPGAAGAPPIGRPLPRTRAYLLGRGMAPMPMGAPGMLYLGGEGLARGYLGRPGLTASRFIPDPFSEKPGGRLYLSGDLARWRTDAQLDFLGRADQQVKLRGFRIELGEVEAALRSHPRLAEAAAMVVEGPGGQLALAAWIVPDRMPGPVCALLRLHLLTRLPDHMVPSLWTTLPRLPLTPNGKLDRSALPPPQQMPTQSAAAPLSLFEELLAGIWCQVLGRHRVGAADNFFELGGHSLLATQVVARLQETTGIELPLQSLFQSPTLSAWARQAEQVLKAGHSATLPPLTAQPRPAELPLSFAQQRLWFLDRLTPGNPIYNLALCYRLRDGLKVAMLEGCLAEIVRRHEALRTRFAEVQGSPAQVVEPARLRLCLVDLSALPEPERALASQRLLQREAFRPFDLQEGPLFRPLLLRLQETEHRLLLGMHHIVSDGWSLQLLERELQQLAGAAQRGQASPLPDLAVQYADYALWQRQWLQGEALERQMRFWAGHLGGQLPVLELPGDRPRPAAMSYRGGSLEVRLPLPLADALRQMGRSRGATLFMTLAAAFQTLLHRWSGQPEVVIGTPVANRRQVEAEGMIGLFVNTLALRGDLSGDPTFEALLGQVRTTALQAYQHSELPFELLVERLQPQRSLSRSPIFQAMLALQSAHFAGPARAEGLRLKAQPLPSPVSRFDLTLSVVEDAAGMQCWLEYSSDLFDAATARRLLGHYGNLLAGAGAEPGCRLSQLPLMGAAERRQLLDGWNDTCFDDPRGLCLHQLFEAQASQKPQALAVNFGDESLSYAQLNAEADRLAETLRRLGAGPEGLVGICLERSIPMVTALLATLKAGAAYLPLDPHYPHERLAFMLEDARAAVLVSQQTLLERLPRLEAPILCLDSLWPQAPCGIESPPAEPGHPQNLCYVIYTSGSTGRPKGVQISHASAANLIEAMRQEIGFESDDIGLLLTSLSFDIAGLEIFLPLTSGARLAIASREESGDGLRLQQRLGDWGVTVMQATPASWRMLLASDWPGRRQMKALCGGEALSPELARDLQQRSAGLWNVYGPTETTIWSTCERVRGAPGPLTIGRPLLNNQVYLLEANLQPVPIGVHGEIYIGGEGLARGYMGRPALTAERFLPDPCSGRSSSRLYRVGDRARCRADGRIEFLGRVDHQLKVRGFRIEPGEIEAALERHPQVQASVVTARADASGERSLVAYLVPAPGTRPQVDSLRAELRLSLPEYMVPSLIVVLEQFPLTPNGKIDRRSLPDPDGLRPASPTLVAPRTPFEAVLAEIWRELLNCGQVGVEDDFFALGGHSLLAAQVLARINQAFDMNLQVRSLFEAPTVGGLAQLALQSCSQPERAVKTAELLVQLTQLSESEVEALNAASAS